MSLRTSAGALAILASTLSARIACADAVIIDDHPAGYGVQLVNHSESPVDQAMDAPLAYPYPGGGPGGALPPQHCGPNVYPRLNAPMYPAPVQHTPEWNGGTFITNQAFAPHEMTYPHKYHAMYPPFYHKVTGKWMWTPFGMRQHEVWKLEGTEVKVNYRSHPRLFSGFHPPR